MVVPLAFDPRPGTAGDHPRYLLLLTGAAVAVVLVVAEAFAGRDPWRTNGLGWPVLGLLLWTAVSAAASRHRDVALSGFPGTYDGLWTAVALAAMFFASVAAFRRREHVVRAFEALWFGAGIPVLAFGLLQLVDRLFFPGGWDWARPSVSPWTIGSTLGNPNHLASFLAVLLPLGLVLAVQARGRRRAAVVGIGVLLVVELAVTASRGAWIAAAAALAVLGLLFRRELRPLRRIVVVALGSAAVVSLVVVVALGAAGVAKRDVGGMLDAGAGSTVDLRIEVWSAAVRMAADHPVVGVGPDVFAVVFPKYASDEFRWRFGVFAVANGAHNVFLNTLADLGTFGLLAFLAVLGSAAARIARTWRRLPPESEDRLLLGGLAAALVAYLVQASFNTQAIALSLCFWVLLGLAATLGGQDEGLGARL